MERIQKGKEEFDRISIAVCDDDEEFIEQLESAVEQTLYAAGGTADIYKFSFATKSNGLYSKLSNTN